MGGIHACAAHVAPWPSVNADGVEDALTLSFEAARRLASLCERFNLLTALEAVVAAQAVDLRGTSPPSPLLSTYKAVRSASPYIAASRSLSSELEELAVKLPTLPSHEVFPTNDASQSACCFGCQRASTPASRL